jgi:hypothetical protein
MTGSGEVAHCASRPKPAFVVRALSPLAELQEKAESDQAKDNNTSEPNQPVLAVPALDRPPYHVNYNVDRVQWI